MLIAPPTGVQKRHFLRLAVLRLAGILTSCSTLDGRLCGAHRTESSAYPDVHTCEGADFMAPDQQEVGHFELNLQIGAILPFSTPRI